MWRDRHSALRCRPDPVYSGLQAELRENPKHKGSNRFEWGGVTMCEFTGNPVPLLDADFERAAKSIDCTVAAVRAVNEVESRSGFFADGRPKILFQRRIFSRMTKRRFNGANPAIADPSSGGSVGDPAEYERLAKAIALDRAAALQSASWGAFQIMGFNHRASGFAAAKKLIKAVVSG